MVKTAKTLESRLFEWKRLIWKGFFLEEHQSGWKKRFTWPEIQVAVDRLKELREIVSRRV